MTTLHILRNFSKNDKGYILYDVIIAIVIVSLALTVLALAYRQSTIYTENSTNQVHALYIAQQELENMKQYDGQSNIPIPIDKTVTRDNFVFRIHTSRINVTNIQAISNKLVPIQITVSWQEPGEQTPVDRSFQMKAYYYVK